MFETIFSSALGQTALVFVLVFAVIFGILQKTELFGSGKKQLDAIIAVVIGLITSTVAYSTDIIQRLVPFMAVVAVILLIFLVLVGFMYHGSEFKVHNRVRLFFGVGIFVALAIAVIYITGAWDYLADWFSGENGGA